MEKRSYELTVVMGREATEKEMVVVVKEWLSKSGGEIKSSEWQGKKELSYPINKDKQAMFGFFELELTPGQVQELQKRIRLTDKVSRHLLVLKNSK